MKKTVTFTEPLKDLAVSSKLLILNFSQIPPDTPQECNIHDYFVACADRDINPRTAGSRQRFNNRMLRYTGARYLVSRYGEDRTSMLVDSSIIQEGRTLHLGTDIFTEGLEDVYAPCDGVVVRAGQEPDNHSFGYYIILQPEGIEDIYIFLGHLSSNIPGKGKRVKGGDKIATLGDYKNHENGGWSRHLHLQMFKQLPRDDNLMGYSSAKDFVHNTKLYPDPSDYFPCLQAVARVC